MFEEFGGFAGMKKPAQATEVSFEPWMPQRQLQPAPLSPFELQKQELDKREAGLRDLETQIKQQQEILQKQQENVSALASQLSAVIQEFEKVKKNYWEQNSAEIAAFAFKIAEIIVQKAIQDDPSVLARQIRSVVEELKINEAMDVQVAASDLLRLQASQDESIRNLLADARIRWHGDQKLPVGGVFIDTSQYRLDASIMTAMKNVSSDAKLNTAGTPNE